MDNIEYTIIRSSRRSVSLVIDTDANLVVRAPFRMTDRAIAEFVASKQNWIEKHLEKMRMRAAKRAEAPSFTQDEREELIGKTVEYIEQLFGETADGHDAAHSLRVYNNAMNIAEHYENCDQMLVALAALLHDTDDHKLFQTENNANARSFMAEQNIDPDTIDTVCEIINSVSFSKNKDKHPETIEAKIVQDADRLDALGAIGIARTFAYGGKKGRPMGDSIEHFHEKLLLLKDLMNTPEARKMAEKRHAFLEQFLEEYANEEEGH